MKNLEIMLLKSIFIIISLLLFNCSSHKNQTQLNILEKKINELNHDKNDNVITLFRNDKKPILQIISDSNTYYKMSEYIRTNELNSFIPYRYFISIPFVKKDKYDSILYTVTKYFKTNQIEISDDKSFFKIYYDYSKFDMIYNFCHEIIADEYFEVEHQNMIDYHNEIRNSNNYIDSNIIQKKFY